MQQDSFNLVASTQFKSTTTALILSLFLGCLGIDRFYVGNIGLGVLKLLTLGCFGIWTFIDWFLISNATRKANFETLNLVLH